uniref:MBL fold metallo-hydrolase n=1 Tax=uncultured Tenacibaculum sp. TaxID=174713 RepID=UPI002632C345|nr:MBL fold metallo-hydrolase [uncultured Tenacibaculum sp.]
MKTVAKDVYHIPLMPRNGINCYIIEGVLIDSGIRNSYKKIVKSVTDVPIHLHALTHAHADHQGCINEICSQFKVSLYCHEKEVARAESGLATKDYPASQGVIAKLQQKHWAGGGQAVSKTLKENDYIENFRVIETPGHADGHLSFFREKDGVLIIGDVATNMNLLTTFTGLHLPPGMFTTNQKENINSLKKLKALHPQVICFGHGLVLVNKNKKFETFVDKFTT